MKIRAIEPGDIPAVADCHARAWQVAFRGILSNGILDALNVTEFEESWRALAAQPGRLNLVADRPHGVVGFVAIETEPPVEGGAGEVIGIYVHPDHWRTGTGKELLAAALAHMSAAGFTSAYLWTMEANRLFSIKRLSVLASSGGQTQAAFQVLLRDKTGADLLNFGTGILENGENFEQGLLIIDLLESVPLGDTVTLHIEAYLRVRSDDDFPFPGQSSITAEFTPVTSLNGTSIDRLPQELAQCESTRSQLSAALAQSQAALGQRSRAR